nr:hypothetical protein [Kibdelosporangium sp. MJ126-NF4]CTQ99189.1 hypothetical protein [Kibdelosporangium sp. MJ126-NF4]
MTAADWNTPRSRTNTITTGFNGDVDRDKSPLGRFMLKGTP